VKLIAFQILKQRKLKLSYESLLSFLKFEVAGKSIAHERL